MTTGSRAKARAISRANAKRGQRQSVHVVSVTTIITRVDPLTGKKTVTRRVRKFGHRKRHHRTTTKKLSPREQRLKEMRQLRYAQTHLKQINAENAKRMAAAQKRLQAKVAAAEQREGRKAFQRPVHYTKRRSIRVR